MTIKFSSKYSDKNKKNTISYYLYNYLRIFCSNLYTVIYMLNVTQRLKLWLKQLIFIPYLTSAFQEKHGTDFVPKFLMPDIK